MLWLYLKFLLVFNNEAVESESANLQEHSPANLKPLALQLTYKQTLAVFSGDNYTHWMMNLAQITSGFFISPDIDNQPRHIVLKKK